MQRNFILTDVMKTGQHQDLHDFINLNSLNDQSFELENEYYRLHNHDLDSYDRRFAIVDVRHDNIRLKESKEFDAELKNRCDILRAREMDRWCVVVLVLHVTKTQRHKV